MSKGTVVDCNAFPNVPFGEVTLRDYFAAMAMSGMTGRWVAGEVDDYRHEHLAEDAYNLADAMLEARNEQGDNQ